MSIIIVQPKPRQVWEGAAKRRAAELLASANEIIGQLLGRYSVGGAEHTTLVALTTQLNAIPSTTNLAASTDEASAYSLLLAAYNAAVAPVPAALKAEYSKIVTLWRIAGRKI